MLGNTSCGQLPNRSSWLTSSSGTWRPISTWMKKDIKKIVSTSKYNLTWLLSFSQSSLNLLPAACLLRRILLAEIFSFTWRGGAHSASVPDRVYQERQGAGSLSTFFWILSKGADFHQSYYFTFWNKLLTQLLPFFHMQLTLGNFWSS